MNNLTDEVRVPKNPFLEILSEIQGVLDAENQKVFAQASMNLGRRWARTTATPRSIAQFMKEVARALKEEFQLAERVKLEKEHQNYVLKVRGCHVCHGPLVLERFGIKPACPISMFPVGAVREAFKVKRVRLVEIRKPGHPRESDLVYEIKV